MFKEKMTKWKITQSRFRRKIIFLIIRIHNINLILFLIVLLFIFFMFQPFILMSFIHWPRRNTKQNTQDQSSCHDEYSILKTLSHKGDKNWYNKTYCKNDLINNFRASLSFKVNFVHWDIKFLSVKKLLRKLNDIYFNMILCINI